MNSILLSKHCVSSILVIVIDLGCHPILFTIDSCLHLFSFNVYFSCSKQVRKDLFKLKNLLTLKTTLLWLLSEPYCSVYAVSQFLLKSALHILDWLCIISSILCCSKWITLYPISKYEILGSYHLIVFGILFLLTSLINRLRTGEKFIRYRVVYFFL